MAEASGERPAWRCVARRWANLPSAPGEREALGAAAREALGAAVWTRTEYQFNVHIDQVLWACYSDTTKFAISSVELLCSTFAAGEMRVMIRDGASEKAKTSVVVKRGTAAVDGDQPEVEPSWRVAAVRDDVLRAGALWLAACPDTPPLRVVEQPNAAAE